MTGPISIRPLFPAAFRRLSAVLYLFLLVPFFVRGQSGTPLKEGVSYRFAPDTTAILQLIEQGKKYEFKASDSALLFHREALIASQAGAYNYGIAYSFLRIAAFYRMKGIYDSTLYYTERSLLYSIRLSNDRGLKGKIYNELGSYYYFRSQYPQAAYFYYKALQEIETSNMMSPKAKSQLYTNISCLWIAMKQEDQALFYLQHGEKEALANHDTISLIRILNNWGGFYSSIHPNSAKALTYYDRSFQLARKLGDKIQTQTAAVNIGNYYQRNHQPEKAIAYLSDVIANDKQLPSYLAISAHLYYGATLIDLKKYAAAKPYLTDALQQAQATGYACHQQVLNYLLGKIAAQSGDAVSTFQYMDRSYMLADSLDNADNKQLSYELDSKYKASEKDKQLAQQQLVLERQENGIRQRNIWIWAVTIISGLLVAAMISFYRNFKRARLLQESLINNLRQTQEISQLRAQIKGEESERSRLAKELHDGVVSQLLTIKLGLNMLRNRNEKGIQPDELNDTLTQLDDTATEVRKMAHNLIPDAVLQSGLNNAVAIFCDKLRKSCAIDIDFQQEGTVPSLPPEVSLSLYRMVQELLQNVVKHAEATEILVQISCWNGLLGITVEDNGIGISRTAVQQGLGLESIRTRVRSLAGQIDISNNNGTTVYLEFEIHSLLSGTNYANKGNHY
ncbi:tetratricopeptide repeat-containing sensor histidine kinase [Taibaiella soli]|uniref:Histidine kinase domain-containing protein n=1 Tax=Taibaiella soli TaxID=1649169 RepID=A0A2W2A6H2_9BACT|nr:tetratricopeptide repeat protein [Taibaiella soli]PZF70865.1 hypothetical protein DN068_20780 [Taibaiella soli]